MTTDQRIDAPPVHRLEPRTEGDWRMPIGRLRAMGRHALADALEVHVPNPARHPLLAREER